MSPESENLLATVVNYLFEDGNKDAASLLLSCYIKDTATTYECSDPYNHDDPDAWFPVHNIILTGSRKACEIINSENPISEQITQAFGAIVRTDDAVRVKAQIALVQADTDWRARLLAEYDTQQVTNQNAYAREPLIWNGMKFSSLGEIEIAKALERVGVMYLPNCLVRVGAKDNRNARFPDFLICYRGKWGILEIDGQTYHTPTNATQDHERRRQIEQHGGIAYFDRFPHEECRTEPDKVVKKFLEFLGSK